MAEIWQTVTVGNDREKKRLKCTLFAVLNKKISKIGYGIECVSSLFEHVGLILKIL